MSSGVMFLLAGFLQRARFSYALCGSLFVVAHGLFHVRITLHGMVPDAYYRYELTSIIIHSFIPIALLATILVMDCKQPH